MPRKAGDTTDDDSLKDGTSSRVTRSLRKRINSVDTDDSPSQPLSGTPRRRLNTITESKPITVDDDVICIEDDESETPMSQAPVATSRRTRTRANSSLTIENVTALAAQTPLAGTDSPVRRATRRNSGLFEASTTPGVPASTLTPGRRMTRRSSMTSDDGSIASSSQPAPRATARRSLVAARAARAASTLNEEDEPADAELPPVAKKGRPSLTLKKPTLVVTSPPVTPAAADQTAEPKLDESELKSPDTSTASGGASAGPSVTPSGPSVTPSGPSVTASSDQDKSASEQDHAAAKTTGEDVIEGTPKSDRRRSLVNGGNGNGLNGSQASPSRIVAVRSSPRLNGSPTPLNSGSPTSLNSGSPTPSKRRPLHDKSIDLTGEDTDLVAAADAFEASAEKVTDETGKSEAVEAVNSAEAGKSAEADESAEADKSGEEKSVDSENAAVAEKSESAVDDIKSEASSSLNDSVEPMEVDDYESAAADQDKSTDAAKLEVAAPEASATDDKLDASNAADDEQPATVAVDEPQRPSSALRRTSLAVPLNKSVGTNKSVTFAEVEPPAAEKTHESSTEEFHDTCGDLPEAAEAEANEPEERSPLLLDAGVTPMRKRSLLSLRSSTPLVPSSAMAASKEIEGEADKIADDNEPSAAAETAQRPALSQTLGDTRKTMRELSMSPSSSEPLLSRSWGHAVRGQVGESIDRSKAKQSSADADEEEVIKAPVRRASLADFDDDDEEDPATNEASPANSFIDGEALEAPSDESEGGSLDSSTRREMDENEIPVDGISIGSKDSEDNEGDDDDVEGDDDESEMDSFIVSDEDGEEEAGNDEDDKATDEDVPVKAKRSRLIVASSSDDSEPELAKDDLLRVDDEDEPQKAPQSPNKSDDNSESNTSAKDESSADDSKGNRSELASLSDRQTKKLLSKTVTHSSESAKIGRHNKSVDNLNGSANAELSVELLAKKSSKTLDECAVADVDEQAGLLPAKVDRKSLKKSSKEDKDDADSNDVTMVEIPVAKVNQKKEHVFKVDVNEILSRCDVILSKANEKRREQKLLNKKDIPDEVLEQKKKKREDKLVEKARRAAAIIEQQKRDLENRKRKAEKKAKKLANEEAKKIKSIADADDIPAEDENAASTVEKDAVETVLPDKKKKKIKSSVDAGTVNVQRSIDQIIEATGSSTLFGAKKPKKVVEYFPVPDVDDIVEPQPTVKGKKSKKSANAEPCLLAKPKKLSIVEALDNEKSHKPKKSEPLGAVPVSDNVKPLKSKSKAHNLVKLPDKKKSKTIKTFDSSNEENNPTVLKTSKGLLGAEKRRLDALNSTIEPIAQPPQSKKFKSAKSDGGKAKKKLKVVDSSSSPEDVGLKVKDDYKIRNIRSLPTASKAIAKKRKVSEFIERPTQPDKPQWTSSGAFLVSKLPSGAASASQTVYASSSSEFVVTELSRKRKLAHTVSHEVASLRETAQFGKRIVRESARDLLRRKNKERANALS